MNNYSHSAEVMKLLEKAQWQRIITEKEEKDRARWKLTGSPEGRKQFRLRIVARKEATTIFINCLLLIILVIVIWETLKQFTFPREVNQVNSAVQEENKSNSTNQESEESKTYSDMHRSIKLRKLDMSPHFGHPLHRQEVLIEEDQITRRNDKLTITGISPSMFCDRGGIQMQIQTNKVLSASVKLSLFFKSRDHAWKNDVFVVTEHPTCS